MAIFVKHIGCNACGSSDANAVYSDNSSYCFSCGATGGATRPGWLDEDEDEEVVRVPENITTDFPQVVLDWIKPTTVTAVELIQHGYFFQLSPPRLGRRLTSGLHPELPTHLPPGVRDPGTTSIEYRNFSAGAQKARFIGSKEEVDAFSCHPGVQQTGRIAIVEDSLSSIRVGRHMKCAPLFGSSVSNNKLARLCKDADEVFVWLDSDKYKNALNISSRVKSLGKKSTVVHTELDPKYVDNIVEVLP